MSLKLDLHVHSISHGKVYIKPEDLRQSLKKKKIDGVAITNFCDLSHALWLKKKINDFIIIVGQEIWAKEGHIIGLGLKERIPDFKSAEETIGYIHKQEGIAIAPHPYLFLGVGKKVMSLQVDAVETYNGLLGALFIPNILAFLTAQKMNITHLASSDTTSVSLIGHSYTEVMTEEETLILENIRLGNVRLHKNAIPIPMGFILKCILNFKNIEPCLLHAVPCFFCGKSMAARLYQKKFRCLECGVFRRSYIACSNGHYLCRKCLLKKQEAYEYTN